MLETSFNRSPLRGSAPFPLATELSIEDLDGRDLDSTRDRLYPHWWIHQVARGRSMPTDAPTYSVNCKDETELKIARAVKPPFVRATLYLDHERVEPPEVLTT